MTRSSKVARAGVVLPLLIILAAVVPTAGATSARSSDEAEVQPRALTRGPDPAVSWLAADVVHTPNGRAHELPWTARGAVDRVLTLRGRTPAGWVVTDHDPGAGTRAWVVAGQHKRQVDLASDSNDEHTWMVARDGTALLKREFTQDFASEMVTRLGDGVVLDNQDFDGEGQVLDFTGPQALLGVDGGTVVWAPGGDTSDLLPAAVAGDLVHDVLVVPGEAGGTVGPTTISDPGPPRWVAPLERVEVSPDGRLVLGLVTGGQGNDGRHVQIRRLSDGEVLAAFHVRNLWRTTLQWETTRSVIFLAARTGLGDVNALVRCRVDGSCNRATAWRELRSISTVRAPQSPPG